LFVCYAQSFVAQTEAVSLNRMTSQRQVADISDVETQFSEIFRSVFAIQ